MALGDKTIQAAQSRARPFVNTRPARTGVRELSDAITGVVDLGVTIAEREKIKEVEQAEALLDDVGVTDSEVVELIDNSFFQPTRQLGRNKRGFLIAEENRAAIEDELNKAPDALAGHAILARWKTELQGQTENADIRAGIGDGITSFGAGLLDERARARQEQVRREERQAEAGVQDSIWNTRKGDFPDYIIEGARAEALASGDVGQFHEDANTGAQNHYAEHPNLGHEIIEQLQRTIDAEPNLTTDDKDRYLTTMKVIRNADQKARDSREEDLEDEAARIALNAARRMAAHVVTNPGQPVTDKDLMDSVGNQATPAATWAALDQAYEARDMIETHGLIGTEQYVKAEAAFRAQMTDSKTGNLPEKSLKILTVYRQLALAHDASAVDTPQKLEGALASIRAEAQRQGEVVHQTHVARRQEFRAEQEVETKRAHSVMIEARAAATPEAKLELILEAKAIYQDIADAWEAEPRHMSDTIAQRQENVLREAHRRGIDLDDEIVNNWEENDSAPQR
ncbi:MAG: hypothetical protein V3S01_07010 [Dehalococcoidia bacterium]